jgi:hypothetical protein
MIFTPQKQEGVIAFCHVSIKYGLQCQPLNYIIHFCLILCSFSHHYAHAVRTNGKVAGVISRKRWFNSIHRNQIGESVKKPATKAEKLHMMWVAQIGCIVCGQPANVHHIRAGQGMGQRASHFDTIPLCHHHHQGAEGIHTLGTRTWQEKYGSERELLEKTKLILREKHNMLI